jgi:hypothetical protein
VPLAPRRDQGHRPGRFQGRPGRVGRRQEGVERGGLGRADAPAGAGAAASRPPRRAG